MAVMRKSATYILILCLCGISGMAYGQDKVEATLEADFVTKYLWRGLDNGDVSIQPTLGIAWKGFSLSAWGSVGISNSSDPAEIDLEASYTIGGLTLMLTDYWTDEGSKYFDFKPETTGHQLEAGIGYDFGVLSLSWQTFLSGADYQESSGKRSYSSYAELCVPFNLATCEWEGAVGVVPFASDYYETEGFRLINLSLKATKDIKITEHFSIPLFAQLMANPNDKKLFFAFGFTLGI